MPFARASETVRVRSPFLAFPRHLQPGSPGHGVVDRRDVALSPLDEGEVDDPECPFGISGARTSGGHLEASREAADRIDDAPDRGHRRAPLILDRSLGAAGNRAQMSIRAPISTARSTGMRK